MIYRNFTPTDKKETLIETLLVIATIISFWVKPSIYSGLLVIGIPIFIGMYNYHIRSNSAVKKEAKKEIDKLQEENIIIPFTRIQLLLIEKPVTDVASDLLRKFMIKTLDQGYWCISVLFSEYSLYEELDVYVEDDCLYDSAFSWLQREGWIKDYESYVLPCNNPGDSSFEAKKKFIFCAKPGPKTIKYASKKLDTLYNNLNVGGAPNTHERLIEEIKKFSVVTRQLGE